MVSGHYVAPSPVQGLAQLLKAYVGRRASDLIPEQQSKLATAQQQQIKNMFGVGGGTTASQARDMALAGGAMQGDVGPTNTNAARMTGVQTGTGSAMPIPAGMDATTAMIQYSINPQAYATALATHSAPTECQKNVLSLFPVGSPQYRAAMQGNLTRSNYIAPTTMAEGSSLFLPGQTTPSYIAPKGGIKTDISPTGQFSSSTISGYPEASGKIEQFQAFNKRLGEAGATPGSRIDLNTGNTVGTTQAEIMGLEGNPNVPQSFPVTQPKTPVVTAINPVVTKAGEDLNNQWIKGELDPARIAGDAARNAMNNIRVLKSIDLTTGFGTDAQKTAANILATFGVKDAAKFATNAQVFESKIYESLVDTLAGQKGVQTKSDFDNIKKTYASLQNTPQANQFLLDVAEAKAMQDQRKSGYYQKAASMPELRNNLSAITNEWGKVAGSIFEVPLTDRAGNSYTLAQKYGIR
jgi:hypothetical protein